MKKKTKIGITKRRKWEIRSDENGKCQATNSGNLPGDEDGKFALEEGKLMTPLSDDADGKTKSDEGGNGFTPGI
jgi:hypothetical protein